MEDVSVVIKRARRSTRRGIKGILLVCVDNNGKELRLWYRALEQGAK